MGWFTLSYLFSTLMSLVSIGRLSEQEKDLEIPDSNGFCGQGAQLHN